MRLTFTVQTDLTDLRERYEYLLNLKREFFKEIQRKDLPVFQKRVDQLMNVAPASPKYPLRWNSERQRKYVMAKLRRERNLPYRRTGRVLQWRLEAVRSDPMNNGGTLDIELRNDVPYAKYVYGDRQQLFHSDTGWPHVNKFRDDNAPVLRAMVMQTWQDLVLTGKR